ncbi:atherin-like [Schistocerca serialis cubense]|uniref:atherin-like n=1 Tax=Schistocerca serialis cubense TaxID=2023355 RepID=UPI00214E5113|nr:atherin-like [Schistocerca serialis cubense]
MHALRQGSPFSVRLSRKDHHLQQPPAQAMSRRLEQHPNGHQPGRQSLPPPPPPPPPPPTQQPQPMDQLPSPSSAPPQHVMATDDDEPMPLVPPMPPSQPVCTSAFIAGRTAPYSPRGSLHGLLQGAAAADLHDVAAIDLSRSSSPGRSTNQQLPIAASDSRADDVEDEPQHQEDAEGRDAPSAVPSTDQPQ